MPLFNSCYPVGSSIRKTLDVSRDFGLNRPFVTVTMLS